MCNRIAALEWEKIKQRPLLTYQTHVARKGWCSWTIESQLSNSLNDKLDIQAIKIKHPDHKIYYAVYFNETEGWSAEVSDGEQAGTTGKGKAVTGIKIRFDETDASEFDVLYRVHTFNGEWTAWSKNGEELLSHGIKLNAIQIRLKSTVAKPSIHNSSTQSTQPNFQAWMEQNLLNKNY